MNVNPLAAALIAATSIAAAQDSRPRVDLPDKSPVVYRADRSPEPGSSVPVGEAPPLSPARIGDAFWICGDGRITTPLPVGYPAPTAPGAIELKTYGVVRKAETSGSSAPDVASQIGFWRLFTHIKSRDIAMTAPVEIEYGADADIEARRDGPWNMAFLYRDPSLGPTGDAGGVRVLDSTTTTYLSLGALGAYGMRDVLRAAKPLRRALRDLPAFEAAGPLRVLHYNGPEAPANRRWMEVQIPVRPKAE